MHGSGVAGSTAHVTSSQLDPGGRSEEVQEHVVRDVPINTTTLVGHLDANVVLALHDLNVDRWNLVLILPGLHGSPHAVLEDLEEHVVEMTGIE